MSSGSSNVSIGVGTAGSVLATSGSGSITWSTTGPILTPQQQQELADLQSKISQITGTTYTFPVPLTHAEQTELDALETQRIQDMIQQQISAFKKVPAPIRQRIVDDIMWSRELITIEASFEAKSARQLELESKKSLTGSGGSFGTAGQWYGPTITAGTASLSYPWNTAPVMRSAIPSRMTD